MKKVNVIELIKNTKFFTLDLFSWGLPMLLLVVWAGLAGSIFHGKAPRSINYLFYFIFSFLPGTSGLFQVIKKEVPWVMGITIKGKWAIVSGITLMLFFWGICIALMYYYLLEFLQSIY